MLPLPIPIVPVLRGAVPHAGLLWGIAGCQQWVVALTEQDGDHRGGVWMKRGNGDEKWTKSLNMLRWRELRVPPASVQLL